MAGRPKGAIDEVAVAMRTASLQRRRMAAGSAGSGNVQVAAEGAGVSLRTMYRRLEGKEPRSRTRWEVTPKVMAAIRKRDGKVATAYRDLTDSGDIDVTIKTVRRGLDLLPPPVREGLLHGSKSVEAKQLYLSMPEGKRNACWQLDHSRLQCLVRFGPNGDLVQPWLTVAIDEGTRFCPGWALTATTDGAADTDSIMAMLAEAIETYGKPNAVRIDQGADFVSNGLQLALHRLDIAVIPCPAGKGHKKGKVERWIGTMKAEILPPLPGYFARPRKAA